jgi:hypothetical protein
MLYIRSSLLGALLILSYFSTNAFAQSQSYCWVDAQNGHVVDADHLVPNGGRINPLDPNHVSFGGRTFFRGAGGSWTDAANGHVVNSDHLVPNGGRLDPLDPRHVSFGGRTFVRVTCPPQTASSSGLYLGGELVKNWGWVRSTERLAATDVVTNQFSDRADPVGGGFLIGYKFAPWANNIVVSPFASFDFLHAPVNHTFPGGSFLGATANFMGTAGVKAGPQLGDGVWLYGIAGVSVLNETLNINFIPVSSSQSAWAAGGTLGIGGAWQLAFLQGFGRPVSLFAEYQHTWWQDANFNTPAASPAFNYTFARQDDVLKFGFTVSLSPPPPAAEPTYPVKAPRLK